MEDRHLLIALNAAASITRAALCRLAQALAAWREARPADVAPLVREIGVPPQQLKRALAVRDRAAELAERELERAAEAGCGIITLADDGYPRQLFDLALPPPLLYCRGRFGDAAPVLAVVGARRMDDYGRRAAEELTLPLAAAGVVIVSGSARGVDTTAHRAALQAPGGRTWAVLGCGLDVDYPRGQQRLRAQIAERGVLLSEFPLGSEPRPWHFPIRNRVIAALASAVLVVQAKPRSGSLITAHHALELGRDVYAVPGRIFDELAGGTNGLLADGALLVQGPEDLLEGLALGLPSPWGDRGGATRPRQAELFPATVDEEAADEEAADEEAADEPLPEGLAGRVLGALPAGKAQTVEDVAGRLEVPVDQVLGALLELEIGGWVRREPGPVYVR